MTTKGFKPDPNLDLLDESEWLLIVGLDPEHSLEETYLTVSGFGGWETTLRPPWPWDASEDLADYRREPGTAWQVDQRQTLNGVESNAARSPITVSKLLEVVPGRFHEWVLSTTGESLDHLESLCDSDSDLELEEGAAMLEKIAALRAELAEGRERRRELRRHAERFYGPFFLYDFAPETDLDWDLGPTIDGVEAILVRPVGEHGAGSVRALVPPDEVTDWRWTDPEGPDRGGEYLTPAEVLAKVPPELRGWVASKTHEALQQARHTLFDLGSRTLSDADDLARMARLAQHAHRLSGFSRDRGISYAGLSASEDEDHVAEARSSDGRVTLLFERSWQHILLGHPEMDGHLGMVVETLERPDHREPDPRPGRERFFRRGGPEVWLRVVVEIAGPIDRVVTAFPQANAPDRWRQR